MRRTVLLPWGVGQPALLRRVGGHRFPAIASHKHAVRLVLQLMFPRAGPPPCSWRLWLASPLSSPTPCMASLPLGRPAESRGGAAPRARRPKHVGGCWAAWVPCSCLKPGLVTRPLVAHHGPAVPCNYTITQLSRVAPRYMGSHIS